VGNPNDPNGPAAGTFLAKVCDLNLNVTPPYDPSKPGDNTNYSSPTCAGKTLTNSYLSQLGDAFTLAPVDVKQKLCALNQVFVTSSAGAMEAWGIWEIAPDLGSSVTRHGNGGVYIVVPDTVLQSATSLPAAESAVYAALFKLGSYPSTLPQLSSQNAASKTLAAGTLAILAHELGHILLADANADGTGGDGRAHPRTTNPDGTALCDPPLDKCFESDFLGTASENHRWNAKDFHTNMRRWIPFNRMGGQHGNKHHSVDFGSVWKNVNANKYADATTGITAIYGSGELASLFAAVTPEEDFVETYKYKTLAAAKDANLRVLDLAISVSNVDLLDAVRKPTADLGRKISCVNLLVP
jgi:hypothetical protein